MTEPAPVVYTHYPSLARIQAMDTSITRWLNQVHGKSWLTQFFAHISRLGDGVFWYGIMLLLPLMYGNRAIITSLHMAVTGLVALFVYKFLKSRTSRPRPFIANNTIIRCAPALDEYSFPSGHTLHAVAFSIILLSYLPQWFWVVVPFSILIALSRPILGLHYASDVVAGAALGGGIAGISLLLFSQLVI